MISTRVTTKSRPELDKAVPTVPTPFSLKRAWSSFRQQREMLYHNRGFVLPNFLLGSGWDLSTFHAVKAHTVQGEGLHLAEKMGGTLPAQIK